MKPPRSIARSLVAALALGTAACGVSLLDGTVTDVPVIVSFSATPTSLPADGGTVRLDWTIQGAVDALGIEPGVGNVTGYTSANIPVRVTTTYTLTASNYVGADSDSVTVTVGP